MYSFRFWGSGGARELNPQPPPPPAHQIPGAPGTSIFTTVSYTLATWGTWDLQLDTVFRTLASLERLRLFFGASRTSILLLNLSIVGAPGRSPNEFGFALSKLPFQIFPPKPHFSSAQYEEYPMASLNSRQVKAFQDFSCVQLFPIAFDVFRSVNVFLCLFTDVSLVLAGL